MTERITILISHILQLPFFWQRLRCHESLLCLHSEFCLASYRQPTCENVVCCRCWTELSCAHFYQTVHVSEAAPFTWPRSPSLSPSYVWTFWGAGGSTHYLRNPQLLSFFSHTHNCNDEAEELQLKTNIVNLIPVCEQKPYLTHIQRQWNGKIINLIHLVNLKLRSTAEQHKCYFFLINRFTLWNVSFT